MKYTVKVIDGPSMSDSDITMSFRFDDNGKNQNVAVIGPDQEITALNVGETKLICEIKRSQS